MSKKSFEAQREAWQRLVLGNKQLEPSAKLVAVAQSWHFNPDKPGSWPSLRTLTRLTGLTRTTIASANDALMAEKLALVLRSWSGQRANANRFIPLMGDGQLLIPDASGAWVLVEVGKGIVAQSHNAPPPETANAACYRLAKAHLPNKVSSVGKRLQQEKRNPEEVLDMVMEAIECDGKDLDHLFFDAFDRGTR